MRVLELRYFHKIIKLSIHFTEGKLTNIYLDSHCLWKLTLHGPRLRVSEMENSIASLEP